MSRPPARTRGLKRGANHPAWLGGVASSREDAWIETKSDRHKHYINRRRVLPRGRVD